MKQGKGKRPLSSVLPFFVFSIYFEDLPSSPPSNISVRGRGEDKPHREKERETEREEEEEEGRREMKGSVVFGHGEGEEKMCVVGKGEGGQRVPALKKPFTRRRVLATDALPLPVWFTNKVFLVLFFSITCFLMRRWREKIRHSTPLHILTLGELLALVMFIASVIYLLGFFGIAYVQHFIGADDRARFSDEDDEEEEVAEDDDAASKRSSSTNVNTNMNARVLPLPPKPLPLPKFDLGGRKLIDVEDDEDIAQAVASGSVPSHALESELGGDLDRAVAVRRRAVELITGRSLEELPLSGFDYASVVGQCCEMVVGYIQIPVGVAGPLVLDGAEYTVPLATTEGALVASTNRGMKAIRLSGGATSTLLRDGMTRAPVLRFPNARRAAEFKFYVEEPANFAALSAYFNSTSRFARLQNIQCAMAGRNVYMRFTCFTGDAMGMNMVTKAVQNVLSNLQHLFIDMQVISISGNFCADKKATAINWIEGRGKSVVCEAVITGDIIASMFKTSVSALVELNVLKNLIGSSMAGALGGFNAHASNIVAALFIATGQDPAQNVESSHCMTLMEPTNGGRDLHVSVTMPCVEVGTTGGGTKLASQAACLNLLGVKGPNNENPGANAQRLARIVAGAVLAGELSLMAAQVTGELVRSHMKYNRSCNNISIAHLTDPLKKGL